MKIQQPKITMQHQWHKQRGASFISWMIIVAASVFVLVTVAKVAPVYMEFFTVKSMVDDIAANEKVSTAKNKRQLYSQLDKYMHINGLYTVKPEYFSVVVLPEQKNAKALQVEYEVRKHWLANIEFAMNFQHAAVLQR